MHNFARIDEELSKVEVMDANTKSKIISSISR